MPPISVVMFLRVFRMVSASATVSLYAFFLYLFMYFCLAVKALNYVTKNPLSKYACTHTHTQTDMSINADV